jgi:hypothetical protein
MRRLANGWGKFIYRPSPCETKFTESYVRNEAKISSFRATDALAAVARAAKTRGVSGRRLVEV